MIFPLIIYSWSVEENHENHTADSLKTLFETTPESCIVEFLRDAWLFYQMDMNVEIPVQFFIWSNPQLM